MRNVAIIWQPHFMSNCFRVATEKQLGFEYNFIVVIGSPAYNGLWRYEQEKKKDFQLWSNKGKTCYCVPISECEKLKDLEDITNENILKEIKKEKRKYSSHKEAAKNKK